MREVYLNTEQVIFWHFPSFSEGLSLRAPIGDVGAVEDGEFPFLFGGTFIEGHLDARRKGCGTDFPSFSEGLSLRATAQRLLSCSRFPFPFLFGGTFIEG